MPILLQYLLKLSISLAVLYIFYRAVLRPLTFYQCNRFYLAGYVLLSFIIPFINIDPWLSSGSGDNQLIGFIPVIGNYTQINTHMLLRPTIIERLTLSDWLIIFFCVGAIVMLIRLVVQYISLRRIRNKAILLEKASGVMVYETSAPVSPFSFGSAVYFNRSMQSEEELERIIQHEFVHVKQKHTIDLVIGELLCIINWYNPFAWLIRHAIRQNLEFIADNNVLENGLDKKEYQYLLLKVMGVPRFSIANNFNFSNLKKRIAMMNKMKSTKVHLTKFLFILPLLMVILVAFRNREINEVVNNVTGLTVFTDTVPKELAPIKEEEVVEVRGYRRQDAPHNSKGYKITIADNNGECVVVVKDRNNKIVKAVALSEWNSTMEATYGKVPPPPPPPVMIEVPKAPVKEVRGVKLQKGVSGLHVNGTKAEVVLTNGTKENYDLSVPAEKAAFDKKYGDIPRFAPPVIIKGVQLAPPAKESAELAPVKEEVVVQGYPRLTDPLYVIDGVVQPKDALDAIDGSSIAKIDVLKGESAAAYGAAGRNGVVSVTTKPGTVVPMAAATERRDSRFADSARKSIYIRPSFSNALIVVDDREYAPGTFDLNTIKPDDIKSVTILKNEDATKVYGEKAKNGVIKIETKHAKTPIPVTATPAKPATDEVIVVGYGTQKKQ